MGITAAELSVKVGADISEGERGLRTINNHVQQTSRFFSDAGKQAVGFGAAMLGLQAGSSLLGGVKDAVFGLNSEIEQSAISWGVMLKSSERAQAMLGQLQQFAATTPFEFPEVERAARKLQAMGFAAKDVIPIMTDIGNTASVAGANGAAAMDGIARALGQMNMLGRASAEDINQLVDAGVNVGRVYEEIGKKTGQSTAQIIKMRDEGKLSSQVFIEAFRTVAQQDFGGLMEKQSKTFGGAMSTIRDNVRQVASTAFKPLFDRVSELAQRLAEFVQSDQFIQWGGRVAAMVDIALNALGHLVSGFGTYLGGLLQFTVTVGQRIYEALQWINPFARHSPSLVESVETGVARIIAAYDRLGREAPEGLAGAADGVRAFREIAVPFLDEIERRERQYATETLRIFGTELPAAYLITMDRIGELRAAAAAMTDEIMEQETAVRELTGEYDLAKAKIRETEAELKAANAAFDEQRAAIRALKREVAEWNLELANVEQSIRAAEAALKPTIAEIEAMDRAIKHEEISLREKELALRAAEAGLQTYRENLTRTKQSAEDAADAHSRIKDQLRTVTDAAKEAEQALKGFANAPLEGEGKTRERLGQIGDQITAVELQMARLRAGGAKSDNPQLKRLQEQLDRLRSQADAVRLEERLRLDPTRRQLAEIANMQAEIKPEEALAGAQGARGQLAAIKPLQDALEAQERSARERAALAKQAADAAKDELEARQKEQEPARQALEADRARVDVQRIARERRVLDLEREKEAIQPLYDQRDAIKEQVAELDIRIRTAELALAVDEQTLDVIKDRLALEREEAEEINTRLTDERERLTGLKDAQQVLISTANAWASELEGVLGKAQQIRSELESAAKAGAGAGPKGGGPPDVGKPSPMGGDALAGIDEVLGPATERLDAIQAQMENTKKEILAQLDPLRQWFDNTGKSAEKFGDRTDIAFKVAQIGALQWARGDTQKALDSWGVSIRLLIDGPLKLLEERMPKTGELFGRFGRDIERAIVQWRPLFEGRPGEEGIIGAINNFPLKVLEGIADGMLWIGDKTEEMGTRVQGTLTSVGAWFETAEGPAQWAARFTAWMGSVSMANYDGFLKVKGDAESKLGELGTWMGSADGPAGWGDRFGEWMNGANGVAPRVADGAKISKDRFIEFLGSSGLGQWMGSEEGPGGWPARFGAWSVGPESFSAKVIAGAGLAKDGVTGKLGEALTWLTGEEGPSSWPGRFAAWTTGPDSFAAKVAAGAGSAKDALIAELKLAGDWIMHPEEGPASWPGKLGTLLDRLATDTKTKAEAIGAAITEGIRSKLEATWNDLLNKLKGLVDMLPEEVKKLLGIKSPSTVFMSIGEEVVKGLAVGIELATPEVVHAAQAMVEAVTVATSSGASNLIGNPWVQSTWLPGGPGQPWDPRFFNHEAKSLMGKAGGGNDTNMWGPYGVIGPPPSTTGFVPGGGTGPGLPPNQFHFELHIGTMVATDGESAGVAIASAVAHDAKISALINGAPPA